LLLSRNTRRLFKLARLRNYPIISNIYTKAIMVFSWTLCENRVFFHKMQWILLNVIHRTVNYLLFAIGTLSPTSSSIFERYRLSLTCFRRLSSSFFNGVHPLPIRIIIRPLRTASFYAIHFGGLRSCSASPKITVVGIIDRRRFATERFTFR